MILRRVGEDDDGGDTSARGNIVSNDNINDAGAVLLASEHLLAQTHVQTSRLQLRVAKAAKTAEEAAAVATEAGDGTAEAASSASSSAVVAVVDANTAKLQEQDQQLFHTITNYSQLRLDREELIAGVR